MANRYLGCNQWAIRNQIAICGSLIISEQSNYYNRFVFVYPKGEIKHYNKRHLFSIAGEHKMYTAGSSQTIVIIKNGNYHYKFVTI